MSLEKRKTINIKDNCFQYMSTKFFRALVSMRKQDPNAARRIYKEIPIQDFTKVWTDKELYEKYRLTEEEISFIEKNVEVMS